MKWFSSCRKPAGSQKVKSQTVTGALMELGGGGMGLGVGGWRLLSVDSVKFFAAAKRRFFFSPKPAGNVLSFVLKQHPLFFPPQHRILFVLTDCREGIRLANFVRMKKKSTEQ